jgi:hypothetical protein
VLHTPNYDVRTRAFCGPTAMSAVTGERISVIRDALRHVSGRVETADGRAYPVKGVYDDDLVNAMQLLGWEVIASETENYNRSGIFRLGDFLDEYGDDGPFIVCVTGHYYAVSHREICDTAICLPKEITRFKRGRARWVRGWWMFAPGVIGTFTEEGFGGVSVEEWVKSWRERHAARKAARRRPDFGVPDQEAVPF